MIVTTPGSASFDVAETDREADTEFIADAHQDVPQLVAEVEWLRKSQALATSLLSTERYAEWSQHCGAEAREKEQP